MAPRLPGVRKDARNKMSNKREYRLREKELYKILLKMGGQSNWGHRAGYSYGYMWLTDAKAHDMCITAKLAWNLAKAARVEMSQLVDRVEPTKDNPPVETDQLAKSECISTTDQLLMKILKQCRTNGELLAELIEIWGGAKDDAM